MNQCALEDAIKVAREGLVPFTYETRVKIERALFVSASRVAQEELNYSLVGFSRVSRRELERVSLSTPRQKRARAALFRAFELKAVLTAMTSGSSYIEGDLRDDLPVHASITTTFVRSLESYARAMASFKNSD